MEKDRQQMCGQTKIGGLAGRLTEAYIRHYVTQIALILFCILNVGFEQIDYTEAILGHASECKDSRCHLTDCHRVRAAISAEHAL